MGNSNTSSSYAEDGGGEEDDKEKKLRKEKIRTKTTKKSKLNNNTTNNNNNNNSNNNNSNQETINKENEMPSNINQDEKVNVSNENEVNNNISNQEMHKISKVPKLKKAKLKPKRESVKLAKRPKPPPKLWEEKKIFCLPFMPTEFDEREIFMDKEYRCYYCDDLCDDENLECKVCPKVAHIRCLYNRGHLEKLNVPLKIEWTCSECSDLSKLLSDETVRNIINVFEELDFRKTSYVRLEDFLRIKKRIARKNADKLSKEQLKNEERRFKLIDTDGSGFIAWNEFVDFETADILSKKNKVELSNHLTIKELITAKHKFLTYDQENMKMIKREDAKNCYLEYIDKLTEKLGEPFLEHIKNCFDLLGFNDDEDDKSTAKIMWDEFIRKMSILLLFDRLNSHHFKPKCWKPGVWYSCKAEKLSIESTQSNNETTTTNDDKPSADLTNDLNSKAHCFEPKKTALPKPSLTLRKKESEKKIEYSSLLTDRFTLDELMSRNMKLDNFKPYEENEFGAYQFVIRSSQLNFYQNSSEDSLDGDLKVKSKLTTDHRKQDKINLIALNNNNNNFSDNENNQMTNNVLEESKSNETSPNRRLKPIKTTNIKQRLVENLALKNDDRQTVNNSSAEASELLNLLNKKRQQTDVTNKSVYILPRTKPKPNINESCIKDQTNNPPNHQSDINSKILHKRTNNLNSQFNKNEYSFNKIQNDIKSFFNVSQNQAAYLNYNHVKTLNPVDGSVNRALPLIVKPQKTLTRINTKGNLIITK